MSLTEFLLARIAEDEAAALEAMGYESRASVNPAKSAAHYVRWDPDRVLAECEAKRQIVAEAQRAWLRSQDDDPMPEGQEWLLGQRQGWQVALRLLARLNAGHPDYRQEWSA